MKLNYKTNLAQVKEVLKTYQIKSYIKNFVELNIQLEKDIENLIYQ